MAQNWQKFTKRLISDAHYHLWKPSTHSWLHDEEAVGNHFAGDLSPVARDYNITEFRNESSKYIIDKSVHLQCYYDGPLQETISLQKIADNTAVSDGHPHGIIGYAELESTDIEQTLLQHMRYPNFRGIRQCLDYHPKHTNRRLCPRDDLMMDKQFHDGLKVMAKYNLIFDMQLYPNQLRPAAVLAAAHPNLSIVINHCAFPMLEEDVDGEWLDGLKLMAAHENVCIKLSGWGLVNRHFDKNSIKYVIKTIIDLFGVDRCMFASDFPVDKIHMDYDRCWDLYVEILQELGYSEQEIDKLIHLNTIKIYKL